MSVRNRLMLGLDESLVVIDQDEVWIPLETTALGKGFAAAWRSGAEAYGSWAPRGHAELVDVGGAQLKYQPGEVPGTASVPLLDAPKVTARVREDQHTIAGWRSEYLASEYAGLRDSLAVSTVAMNEMARVYLMAGQIEPAAAALEKALSAEPSSARTLNNLAVVDAARGDLEGASTRLHAAQEIEADDPGPWLNLGLIREAAGDSSGASAALNRGIMLSGGYTQACAVLGIPAGDAGGALEGTKRMTLEEARELLKSAVRRVPPPPAGTTAPRKAPRPKAWTSRVAGGRSAESAELTDLLYWKR
ncbi:MAG: tetratricopeptide repeat protein [Gaiellaceae bacterium]